MSQETLDAVIDIPPYSKNPQDVVENLRRTFNTNKTKCLKFRRRQLKNFLKFFEDNLDDLCDAVYRDLRKSRSETIITEVQITENEIKNLLFNLGQYAGPEYPEKCMPNYLDGVEIRKDPYGVVLIIGAWNYPLCIPLNPMAGAIAAGNCVLLKPSEMSPATSELIAKLLPHYLDSDCYKVCCGGIPETTEILKQKFDYIFYTGSTNVGKIIHKAANENLTPVTLELGGKSPVFIDNSADMEYTARRILWGKCMNAGQTCVAPDYILCNKQVQDKFLFYAEKVIKEFFGNGVKSSPDFGRIVNDYHFGRLAKLLKDDVKIAIGGHIDATERFISPTIVIDVLPDEPLMQEEIFGPILPIVNVSDINEAVRFINEREKPLAIYLFSKNNKDKKFILDNTSSGGVTVNDVIMHLTVENLPFGGVGPSGMGAYHGRRTFDTFVHEKAVLVRNFRAIPEMIQSLRYPPYSNTKLKLVTAGLERRRGLSSSVIVNFFYFLFGVLITAAVFATLLYLHQEENIV